MEMYGPRTQKKEKRLLRLLQRAAHPCMTKGHLGWALRATACLRGLAQEVGNSQ